MPVGVGGRKEVDIKGKFKKVRSKIRKIRHKTVEPDRSMSRDRIKRQAIGDRDLHMTGRIYIHENAKNKLDRLNHNLEGKIN